MYLQNLNENNENKDLLNINGIDSFTDIQDANIDMEVTLDLNYCLLFNKATNGAW